MTYTIGKKYRIDKSWLLVQCNKNISDKIEDFSENAEFEVLELHNNGDVTMVKSTSSGKIHDISRSSVSSYYFAFFTRYELKTGLIKEA